MEIAVIAALVAAGLGVLMGGTLESLSETRFSGVPLLFAGFALQIVFSLWQPSWLEGGVSLGVLIVSNLLVASFVWLNRRLAGMVIAGAGLVLNVLVIALNGAMPVSGSAIRTVGGAGAVSDADIKHTLIDDDTRLPWIADVIPLALLGTVASAGDVLLAAGIARVTYVRTLAGRNKA